MGERFERWGLGVERWSVFTHRCIRMLSWRDYGRMLEFMEKGLAVREKQYHKDRRQEDRQALSGVKAHICHDAGLRSRPWNKNIANNPQKIADGGEIYCWTGPIIRGGCAGIPVH